MTLIPSRRDAFWARLNEALERHSQPPANGGELLLCLPFTGVDVAVRRVVQYRSGPPKPADLTSYRTERWIARGILAGGLGP